MGPPYCADTNGMPTTAAFRYHRRRRGVRTRVEPRWVLKIRFRHAGIAAFRGTAAYPYLDANAQLPEARPRTRQ